MLTLEGYIKDGFRKPGMLPGRYCYLFRAVGTAHRASVELIAPQPRRALRTSVPGPLLSSVLQSASVKTRVSDVRVAMERRANSCCLSCSANTRQEAWRSNDKSLTFSDTRHAASP